MKELELVPINSNLPIEEQVEQIEEGDKLFVPKNYGRFVEKCCDCGALHEVRITEEDGYFIVQYFGFPPESEEGIDGLGVDQT